MLKNQSARIVGYACALLPALLLLKGQAESMAVSSGDGLATFGWYFVFLYGVPLIPFIYVIGFFLYDGWTAPDIMRTEWVGLVLPIAIGSFVYFLIGYLTTVIILKIRNWYGS